MSRSTGDFLRAASGTSRLAFRCLAGARSLQGSLAPSTLGLFLFLVLLALVIFKNIQRNMKTSRKKFCESTCGKSISSFTGHDFLRHSAENGISGHGDKRGAQNVSSCIFVCCTFYTFLLIMWTHEQACGGH